MKKIYSLITLCMLLCSFMVRGASEANFKLLEKQFTLLPDGGQELRVKKILKLHTHMAFNSLYGETFIVYNPAFQSLKINECYTTMNDGKVVKAPDNAFNEVLPKAAADAPYYNNLIEMVVTHTGLELGATIYLDYTVSTKAGFYPALDIDEILQEASPIDQYVVSVTLPNASTLSYELTGRNSKPAINKEGNTTSYKWTLKNIPANSKESFLPENKNNVPRLSATTYGGVEKALMVLNQRITAASSSSVNSLAETLTKDCNNKQDKINAILKFVADQTALSGVLGEWIGYSQRANNTVASSSYGTEIEKTALLLQLLKASGIDCKLLVTYPATITGGACGLKNMKNMYVECDNLFYSAKSTIAVIPGLRNELDTYYYVAADNVTKATLVGNKQNTYIFNDTIKNTASFKEGYLVYPLPRNNGNILSWGMDRLNSVRKEIFELPSIAKDSSVWTIVLSEGMKLATPVSQFTLNEKVGKASFEITQSGNVVTVKQVITLSKQQVAINEYSGFRKLITEYYLPKWNNLLIKQ